MDVVALSQFGVGYAVATLGTATTPWQVQKLLRQTDNVIYCFDGDAAGRRAAWRALENSLSQLQDGKQVNFLFLPPEDDPDSYVRTRGQAAFEGLLGKAQPLSEFLVMELTGRVDMRTAEGRAKFLQDARPLVKQVTAPMLSLMLRKQMADLAGIAQAELDRSFEIKQGTRSAVSERRNAVKPSLARQLSEMLVFRPLLGAKADPADLCAILDAPAAEIPPAELVLLSRLLELCRSRPDMRTMAEHFRGDELEAQVRETELNSLKWEALDDDALLMEFETTWSRFRLLAKKAELDALKEKSRRAPLSEAEKLRLKELVQIRLESGATAGTAPV